MPTMLQRKRAQRRKALAEDVRRGASVRAVAEKRGVSADLVRSACREHGVQPRSSRKIGVNEKPVHKLLQIIAGLLSGYTLEKIGRDAGITRQRVSQIKQRVVEAGIYAAVQSLGKSLPESNRPRLDDVKKLNIVAWILKGKSQKAICREFHVGPGTLRRIAQQVETSRLMEFSFAEVRRPVGQRISRKILIAKELLDKERYGSEVTLATIARKHDVDRSFVDRVVREMKDAGILTKRLRHGRASRS